MDYTILKKPLTKEEIKEIARRDPDDRVEGVVAVPIGEIVEENIEFFYDLLEELLVGGYYALEDIEYTLVGCNLAKQELHIEVSGNYNLFKDEDEEEGEENN
jgi:hypothetical protein